MDKPFTAHQVMAQPPLHAAIQSTLRLPHHKMSAVSGKNTQKWLATAYLLLQTYTLGVRVGVSDRIRVRVRLGKGLEANCRV